MTDLAFSTLGCSGASLDTILKLAQSNNIRGLELRATPDEFTHVGLTAAKRRTLRNRIDDAGLEILAINSYVHLCGVEDQPLDQHLDLAADLGARGVRAFMRDDQQSMPDEASTTGSPTPGELRAMDRVAAAPKDVHVLLETHDSHSAGRRMAAFCALLDQEVPDHNAKVIWDSAHTWSHGESPAESLEWELKWHPDLPPLDEALPATWNWISSDPPSR